MIYIYTKEKCAFCTKAKKLLTQNNLEYEERIIKNKNDNVHKQLKLLLPKVTTVPQIFYQRNNKRTYIGGYEELVEWIK